MRHRLVTALVALVLVAAPQAQTTPAPTRGAVSSDRLMATVRTLAGPDFAGRAAGTPGGARARAWIVERLAAIDLPPVEGGYERPFSFSRPASAPDSAPVEGVNLAGICRGSEPELPYIVVSAHYDHVGVRDGAIYPGADDNASGVAVLLELARACVARPFRHSVLVVAFDAEEMGLQGARAFVASPPVPRSRLALDVNLDMVARGDKGELYVSGTSHHPTLRPLLAPVADRAPITLLFGHDTPGSGHDDWTSQSDHGAFHAAGIPFVYFGVEDHPDYHKPTDTADKIDPTFFAAAANTILDAVRALDQGLR